jgi:ribosome maturation factor RimP
MGGTRARTEQAMRTAVEPVLAGMGVDLESLEVRPAGRRDMVRVIVDQDGGLDLDRVAEVSVAVSAVLDASDEVSTLLGERSYVLEVSSPGVDRPLTLSRHWRRATGRLVTAYLTDGTSHEGRVAGVDETSAVVVIGDRSLSLADIDHGDVHVEFTAPSGD